VKQKSDKKYKWFRVEFKQLPDL